MTALSSLLLAQIAPGNWLLTEFEEEDRQLALTFGARVSWVDLSGVDTKDGLMTILAEALALPDYFGRNLDALYDCLTDHAPHVLLFEHPAELLASEPSLCRQLCELAHDARDWWLERDQPFSLVWLGRAPDGVPDLALV